MKVFYRKQPSRVLASEAVVELSLAEVFRILFGREVRITMISEPVVLRRGN